MERAYHFVGQDGQTYGPVSLEDLRLFVADGRLAANAFVIRDDQTDWTTVAACPELKGEVTQSAARTVAEILDHPARATAEHRDWHVLDLPKGVLRERADRGARMFFLIPALAAVIYLFWLLGAQHIPKGFIASKAGQWTQRVIGKVSQSLSLAAPQMALRVAYGYDLPSLSPQFGRQSDIMPQVYGPRARSWLYTKWARITMEMGAILFLALFGVFARERKMWAFIAGLTFYALDLAFCAYYRNWWAAGFHLLPATYITIGLRANWQLVRS